MSRVMMRENMKAKRRSLFIDSDYLRGQVKAIYRGNGDEAIELVTGSRLIFKTRTKGGGRGLSGSKVILDEGMFLQPMHMGSLAAHHVGAA